MLSPPFRQPTQIDFHLQQKKTTMTANALTGKWNQAIQITSNIAAVHY